VNPEFLRNVWLELTPQRLGLMTGGLALAFLAAALPGGLEEGALSVSRWLYLVIVVVFGTRSAALAVVGEIRDRTWDSQRLSSLTPAQMMWGKLLGSTIYAWYGGVLCLAVIFVGMTIARGPYVGAIEAAYYLVIGAIAQAAAFLASLIAIQRRQQTARLGAFAYQLTGIAAAALVALVWSYADPVAVLQANRRIDVVLWWGREFDALPFLLVSLGIFAGWILLACYREMRIELQLKNGPFVWLAFLAFIALYVAGFDAWLPKDGFVQSFDQVGLRLALADTAFVIATYVMVLLEPKDRVHYRWLLGRWRAGEVGAGFMSLQAWMMSYLAAIGSAVALAIWLNHVTPGAWDKLALIAATLGFLTRDVSIFVLVQTIVGRGRGDLGAIVILTALYLLLPAILAGFKLTSLLFVFYPVASSPIWLGPLVAWAQGLAVAASATARVSLGEISSAASPKLAPVKN
jgi:hypothetical protein